MRLLRAPTLGLVTAALAGCMTTVDLGRLLPEAGADGADVGQTCPPGRYVTKPQYWEGPYWLWVGPNDGQAPSCPNDTVGYPWEGYADLIVAPPVCASCTCGLSTGACELPSILTASTTGCNISGGVATSFNAPESWNGECDNMTQVPAMAANSLWIAPLTIKQESCEANPPIILKKHPYPWYSWKTLGRSCEGWGWSWSQNPDTVCIPDDQPAPKDFRLCVSKEGNFKCNSPDWPDGHVFYNNVHDERQCTECTCGAATGSKCTSVLDIDKDPVCMAPVEPPGISISSENPACIDFSPSEQTLASKHATPPVYIPGTCEPMGGEPMDGGTVEPSGPVTFCCQ